MNNKPLNPSAHFVMPDAPFGDPHYNLAVWGTSCAGKTALLQPILQRMREQLGPVNEAELAAVQTVVIGFLGAKAVEAQVLVLLGKCPFQSECRQRRRIGGTGISGGQMYTSAGGIHLIAHGNLATWVSPGSANVCRMPPTGTNLVDGIRLSRTPQSRMHAVYALNTYWSRRRMASLTRLKGNARLTRML